MKVGRRHEQSILYSIPCTSVYHRHRSLLSFCISRLYPIISSTVYPHQSMSSCLTRLTHILLSPILTLHHPYSRRHRVVDGHVLWLECSCFQLTSTHAVDQPALISGPTRSALLTTQPILVTDPSCRPPTRLVESNKQTNNGLVENHQWVLVEKNQCVS